MGNSAQTAMAVYELPLGTPVPGAALPAARRGGSTLSEALLVDNATWFCRLRWGVIAILVLFGLLSCVPGLFVAMGVQPRLVWPFGTGILLAIANLGFRRHLRTLRPEARARQVRVNLWSQIVIDLAVLTAVVHFCGYTDTPIYFAYLFHVVLACIFFSTLDSLLVTVLACLLYSLCGLARVQGLLGAAHILPGIGQPFGGSLSILLAHLLLPQLFWLIVWFLTTHLARLLQERDLELAVTNRQLVEAQSERVRHMLHTTHELKAPFAAIHANAQLLMQGYCGVLPAKAMDVVGRIAARSQRLAWAIRDMLQLANLGSAGQTPPAPTRLDLVEVLRRSVEHVGPQAARRGVDVRVQGEPAAVFLVAPEDHLRMLFDNLLANAVAYSYDGGEVSLRYEVTPAREVIVTVEDHGIGIAPAKLPRVFDEYYRTEEAVRHCSESTGLGLAIVREVAQSHGFRLRVESRPGMETRFVVRMPTLAKVAEMTSDAERVYDGVHTDCR
jgi:signal transduction histidine kinase